LGGHGPPESSHRNAAAGAIAFTRRRAVVLPVGDSRELPIAPFDLSPPTDRRALTGIKIVGCAE
jgi:hypothetical protein